ncbi:hypothetical protein OH807_18380 [Kitasatospora sp. NBC_01560]|uniref:hypothetical protein n=1 Tax=Kitasatospora sp. NBC_01560 TaxID=2975965 RepID=UPI003863EE8B
MSIHLFVVAGYLEKEVVGGSTHKLVLQKLADSADDQTRLSAPGLTRLIEWSMVEKPTVLTIITDLIGRGLVERVTVGRSGQRAVYRVFPEGVPPIPSTEELEARRTRRESAPKNPRLARKPESKKKPDAPARTRADVQARAQSPHASAPAPDPEAAGSPIGNLKAGGSRRRKGRAPGLPEGNPDGAGLPIGNPDTGEPGVSHRQPPGFPPGDPGGFPTETPVLPVPSSSLPFPPTPAAGAAGESAAQPRRGQASGCPKHTQPAANCRGCGTSPRAQREAQRKALADADRRNDEDWLRAFTEEQRERRQRIDSEPVAVAEAFQAARDIARAARTRAKP